MNVNLIGEICLQEMGWVAFPRAEKRMEFRQKPTESARQMPTKAPILVERLWIESSTPPYAYFEIVLCAKPAVPAHQSARRTRACITLTNHGVGCE